MHGLGCRPDLGCGWGWFRRRVCGGEGETHGQQEGRGRTSEARGWKHGVLLRRPRRSG
ncbi:hypothetical protein SNL152K_2507 [Streptomyces sp. NL15-2K]|nr:hypothetical protein SNL152K_2507 [Streptomyces sp. NL15-2K]